MRGRTAVMMAMVMVATVAVTAAGNPDGHGAAEQPPGRPDRVAAGRFEPVTPVRLVDTRSGSGGRLAAGTTGRYDLSPPPSVAAVTLNVTAVHPGEAGFFTLYPCDQPLPDTSNVNYAVGSAATANQVTVALAGDGSVCVHTSAAADLLLDLAGWWRPGNGAMLVGTRPQRLYDSRPGRRPAGSRLVVDLSRRLPPATVAVSLTVTSTDTVADGFVTVHDCDDPLPVVSNLNPSPGLDRPNLATVATRSGVICVYTHSETALVVDFVGAWTRRAGGPQLAADRMPDRVVDTRASGDRVPRATVRTLRPPAAEVVIGNVTATNVDEPGWLAVFPCADGFTGTSSVNYRPGASFSTAVAVDAARGGVCTYASSDVDVVFDVFGAAA